MEALEAAVRSARNRVLVQAMTVEGDEAGRRMIDLLRTSSAKDRALCIDSYSKVVVNDRFAWRRPEREEKRRLDGYLRDAGREGVAIAYIHPVGPLAVRYPWRNHRKIVVVDDTVFLGGLNFSDHNFLWTDLMVRFDDARMADLLAADIRANMDGFTTSGIHSIQDGTLYQTHPDHPDVFQALFDHFRSATESILILSPYVTAPLLDILRKEVSRKVDVRIVTPAVNNKAWLGKILCHEARSAYFSLHRSAGGMSHLKAALVDGRTLLIGSSNYDFASVLFEDEVMVATTDGSLVREFQTRVAEPLLAASEQVETPQAHPALHSAYTCLYRLIRSFS